MITLKPDYDSLSTLTLIWGIILVFLGTFTLAHPRARDLWLRLPRSVWPGRILTIVCMIWAALWLCVMPLGPVTFFRDILWILIPASVALIWIFIPELLTCRAIGGLLVLVPTPLLSAAAWHPSPARYIVIICAYAMIIKGMFYISLPYLMRDHLTWATATPTRQRGVSIAATAFGAILIALSLAVFPVA